MLYVTTRSNRDAFTPRRTLCEDRGPDGGFFIPFRDPQFTQSELISLRNSSFSKCVADVLNKLFGVHLTSFDVELTAGRYPVRLVMLNQRLIVGETWHNLESEFSCMVNNLSEVLRNGKEPGNWSSEWATVAVRIAVLFGIFGELMRLGIANAESTVDVSVVSGDFSSPISLWYARKWGLPIGNIVCCCNENGNLWDFVCHGQLRTDSVAKHTSLPDADVVVPKALERLIHVYGGSDEVDRYLKAVRSGSSYYLDDKLLRNLREGIYVTVSSERRILSVIPGVYTTHQYFFSPYGALAYAGLQDYRSRTGENRTALILTEKSPLCDSETVAFAMGLPQEKLYKIMDRIG